MTIRVVSLAVLAALIPTSSARPQGALDHIPPNAVGALVFRNVAELVRKGDDLVKKGHLPQQYRLSQLIPFVYAIIGVQAGDIDEEKPISVVAVSAKTVDPQRQPNDLDGCLVVGMPFKDLDRIAGRFGFEKGELKPEKVTDLKRETMLGRELKRCYVSGSRLYLGGEEKAILAAARTKGLGVELNAAQRELIGRSEVILHLGTEAWGDLWKHMLRDVEKMFEAGDDEAERKAAKDFVAALGSVRFGLAGLRVEDGLGFSVLSVFPKDSEASKNFLTTLRAGDGASSLKGLPEGTVVAAQAAKGDGAQNAAFARLFFRVLVREFLEPTKVFGAGDRPALLAVFNEVWQRLQGSRMALYRTADPAEVGLFSVVGILDAEDPSKFLDELRQLARLGSADGLDLKTEAGKKATEAEIQQLIKDLGSRRFSVRQSAEARLALAGEPVLPYLEKAIESGDLETRRRAENIKRDIVAAAEASRKALLSGELTLSIKPSFAFLEKTETMEGVEVRSVAVRLSKRDAAVVPQMKKLLGPDWDRVRVAVHGKQVAVLVGTDVGLFRKALVNLKENKAGLAGSKALAAQAKQTDAARKVEVHVSAMLATMLATAQDLEQPGKAAAGSLSSATLTVEPDRLQVDVWLPGEELQVLTGLFGR